jgi:hypothetical protein
MGAEVAMTLAEILRAQFLDPFRILLLAGLVLTMLRTEAATGRWLPLALGAVFVAVLIPLTTEPAGPGGLAQAVAAGIFANLVILAVLLALVAAWRRLRG